MKDTRAHRSVFVGFLLCTLAGLLLAGTACQQTSSYLKILPRTTAAFPGETFALEVVLDPAPSHAVAGVQFDLSFNSTLLQADSVAEGTLLGGACDSTFFSGGTIDNDAGTITDVVGIITEPGCSVSTTGTVAAVTFTASLTTGTSHLRLTSVRVEDAEGNRLSSVGYTATVEVSGGPTPSPTALPTVTMSCTEARDTTQAALDGYHAEHGEWPTADGQPGDIVWPKLVPQFMDGVPSNDGDCDWWVNSSPEGDVCVQNMC